MSGSGSGAGGYDLGAALSWANSSSAGISSAFNVTGGGGSNAPGGTNAVTPNYLALILGVAGLGVIAFWLFISRK